MTDKFFIIRLASGKENRGKRRAARPTGAVVVDEEIGVDGRICISVVASQLISRASSSRPISFFSVRAKMGLASVRKTTISRSRNLKVKLKEHETLDGFFLNEQRNSDIVIE